jgi:hypothetical protein
MSLCPRKRVCFPLIALGRAPGRMDDGGAACRKLHHFAPSVHEIIEIYMVLADKVCYNIIFLAHMPPHP